MQPFLDTANLDEIKIGLAGGYLRGITTNPTIMAREPKTNYVGHIQKIADLCTAAKQPVSLSIEVFAKSPEEMLKQARQFIQEIHYPTLAIKIPIASTTLGVIAELARAGVRVNVTCGVTASQGEMAAMAGGTYYSLFFHRIKDLGVDAAQTVRDTKAMLAGTKCQIICGSIRNVEDVMEASLAGSDIITAPLKIWQEMANHPKSDEWNEKFLQDFAAWVK